VGDYPWPFAGYAMLPGRTACRARLDDDTRASAAEPLADFLAALHAIPATEARALGAPGDNFGRADIPFALCPLPFILKGL
jgi:aminoglycoside phosphotransferase (APT) family kinase protein